MSVGPNAEGTGPHDGWFDEHRFEVLIGTPAVRDAVTRNARAAQAPVSAEEFLSRAGAVIPLVGRQIRGSAARGNRLGNKLRLRTVRTCEAELPEPVGRAIAAVLCSLALHCQEVRSVEQHEDGCTLTADIPSDSKTFGGVLEVGVGRSTDGITSIRAKAEIPGQLFDWGKSKQTLDRLVADLQGTGHGQLP